jgi:PAS domain S-box-containing protein
MNDEGVTPADPSPILSRLGAGISLLLDRAQDAAFVTDAATGRIRLWNAAAATLFGYATAEAMSLFIDQLVPNPHHPRLHAELARFTTAEYRRTVERTPAIAIPIRTKSGVEHPAVLTLTPLDELSTPGRHVLVIAGDVTDQVQAREVNTAGTPGEADAQRLTILAEATALLASSHDHRATLAEVVKIVVPIMADGCTAHLVDDNGTIQMLASASMSAERDALIHELGVHYPISRDAPAGSGFVLHTGRSQLYNGDLDLIRRAIARDGRHLDLLRRLGTTSRMIVPLRARDQTYGVISFSLTRPERRYAPADLALAEELARRAALAIDNARRYQALSLSEQRYRSFVQQATDVIAVVGPDGLLQYVSPSVESVLGFPPESLVGVRTSTLVHPDDRDKVWEVARNVVQKPRINRKVEVRLRHADDSWRTLELSVTNLFSDPAIQGVVINLHDVTERQRSEEDERFLADAGTLLATSLDYDTTVSQLPELAVPRLGDWCVVDVVDEEGSIRRTAVACHDPIVARALEELPRLAPIGQGSTHPVAVALRTGEPVILAEFSRDMSRVARSAEQVALLTAIRTRSLISVPLLLHDRRLGVITFGYLDSDRRHDQREQSLAKRFADRATLAIRSANLYHEAQAALTEVQRALNLRDEFLLVASHELRTPLTALKGQIQLAERRLRRGQYDAVPTLIHHADAQVDRLTRLVRDLLDVSRIGSGGITMEFQPVALGALVQHVVDLEREAAPGRAIVLDLPATTPTIDADAQRIEQVLFNLLQNARKYSLPDTTIEVRVRVDEDVVTIAVVDHGEGIPADDLPHIFERFHRARNVDRNIAGLGLGLYITREIVRAHGGNLTVESTVDQGSTFTVTLPWSAEPE